MKILNFIVGGRTGDFIHNLMVVKSLCEKNNAKANIFLSHNHGGDLFYKSLEETLNDLSPLIVYQPYIKSFRLYTDEPIHYNLNQWRNSPLFFKFLTSDSNQVSHNACTFSFLFTFSLFLG